MLDWIKCNKGEWSSEIDLKLKSIGDSQLDYYVGAYSEQEVRRQVANRLFLCGCNSLDSYIAWIARSGTDYRTVELNDRSEWTLRFLDQENYIHLHPSRYSLHTRRIKATSLKTVACYLLFTNELNYDQVNSIRINKLGLSPIDVTKQHKELDDVFALFTDNIIFPKQVQNLYEYIDFARKRPGMYFGDLTGGMFKGLQEFVGGYQTACWLHNIDEKLNPPFSDFNKYVANYYQCSDSLNCFTLILAKCYNNEVEAFLTFYKLFDAFRENPILFESKE